MTLVTALEYLNYGLVLLFGVLLSVHLSGGCSKKWDNLLVAALFVFSLILQALFSQLLGLTVTKQLYPLICHLPLFLMLVLGLKKTFGIALVSILTAYFCCQLPRWMGVLVLWITNSQLVYQLGYLVALILIYCLLWRFFVRAAATTMNYSKRVLYSFGVLPFVYYIFDYATTIYSHAFHSGVQVLNEFFPTAMAFFYVLFIVAYHSEMEKRMQAELQSSMLEVSLKQSEVEMAALHQAELQTAIYQHDMRHYLTMIDDFLSMGKVEQATDYIYKTRENITSAAHTRFCENDTVNLLCSSFSGKASRANVRLTIDAKLPSSLPIPDTELCAVISNGLENALTAVANLDEPLRQVEFYCGIRMNKLLIEIKNPYSEQVPMQNGLPVSRRTGHGYGCRSILSIATRHRGICTFEPENGVFTLRVALPIEI